MDDGGIFNHDRNLFVKNGLQITFFMRPCAERISLKPVIEYGGGSITSSHQKANYKLAEKGSAVLSDSYISTAFIYDSVQKNQLQDINHYRLKLGSVLKDSEADMLDDGMSPASTIVTTVRDCKGRTKYTQEEDLAMLRYIVTEHKNHLVSGMALWKEMEGLNVTLHTAQSMEAHFRKTIMPNLRQKYRSLIPEHWISLLTGHVTKEKEPEFSFEDLYQRNVPRKFQKHTSPSETCSLEKQTEEQSKDVANITSSYQTILTNQNTHKSVSSCSDPDKTQETTDVSQINKRSTASLSKKMVHKDDKEKHMSAGSSRGSAATQQEGDQPVVSYTSRRLTKPPLEFKNSKVDKITKSCVSDDTSHSRDELSTGICEVQNNKPQLISENCSSSSSEIVGVKKKTFKMVSTSKSSHLQAVSKSNNHERKENKEATVTVTTTANLSGSESSFHACDDGDEFDKMLMKTAKETPVKNVSSLSNMHGIMEGKMTKRKTSEQQKLKDSSFNEDTESSTKKSRMVEEENGSVVPGNRSKDTAHSNGCSGNRYISMDISEDTDIESTGPVVRQQGEVILDRDTDECSNIDNFNAGLVHQCQQTCADLAEELNLPQEYIWSCLYYNSGDMQRTVNWIKYKDLYPGPPAWNSCDDEVLYSSEDFDRLVLKYGKRDVAARMMFFEGLSHNSN